MLFSSQPRLQKDNTRYVSEETNKANIQSEVETALVRVDPWHFTIFKQSIIETLTFTLTLKATPALCVVAFSKDKHKCRNECGLAISFVREIS